MTLPARKSHSEGTRGWGGGEVSICKDRILWRGGEVLKQGDQGGSRGALAHHVKG